MYMEPNRKYTKFLLKSTDCFNIGIHKTNYFTLKREIFKGK